MPTIDRDSPEPPSRQIAAELIKRIRAGAYPVDRRLPSENVLMTEWGTTRTTAHKAVEILLTAGWVYRVKGMGTYVARDTDPDPAEVDQGAEVDASE